MAGLEIGRAGYGTWAVYSGGTRVSGQLSSRMLAESALERIERARRVKTRSCLTCGQEFRSEGPHNRMCDGCRRTAGGMDRQMF